MHLTDTSLVVAPDPAGMALEGFWTDSNLICTQLHYCETISASFWLHVKQPAAQNETYTFLIRIEAVQWNKSECGPGEAGGTIGFWKNWNAHNTYRQGEIETWLSSIDAISDWLGPTTTAGMPAILTQASGGTTEQKFLGHYLATRLDVQAGRLALPTPHDTTYDPGNYLGLTTPAAATLSEIVWAIESKYSMPSPDSEVMKDVCDALNNLYI